MNMTTPTFATMIHLAAHISPIPDKLVDNFGDYYPAELVIADLGQGHATMSFINPTDRGSVELRVTSNDGWEVTVRHPYIVSTTTFYKTPPLPESEPTLLADLLPTTDLDQDFRNVSF